MANLHRWQASSRRNHCSPKITSPFSTVSTQLCHRPASHVAMAKWISAPIKGRVWADTMLLP